MSKKKDNSKKDLVQKDIVGYSIESLKEKLLWFKKELFNLRFQRSLGDLKNTSRFSVIRKNIARIQTELTARCKSSKTVGRK